MRRSKGRRLKATSGYIGFGNQSSVFTRTAKLPFSKMKTIYGEELERLNSKKTNSKQLQNQLTKAEKLEIKNRLNKEFATLRKKQLIAVCIAIILLSLLLFWINSQYFN